jgi:hypothetical protein
MDRASSVWSKAAGAAALAVFVFHVYRAGQLAITTDEAFTFQRFVGVRWLDLLRGYDANHHILHSILCKLSVGAFGAAEWSLRLPALAGCGLYLYYARRLAMHFAGTGPAMLASFLWLCGLPQIAEYLSLARGYSLGLGCLAAALWHAVQPEPRWPRVSAWLGLSVASNLVFLIPAGALGLVCLRQSRALPALTAPAAAVLAWTLAVPLHYASLDNYYFGVKTWNESVHSLLVFPWLKAGAALALVLGAAAAWRAAGATRQLAQLLALALALPGILFVFRNVPLPYERTGIYLLFLLALLVGPACRWPRAELPLALLFGGLAVAAGSHLSARQSGVWTFDAFQRAGMERIRRESPAGPVRVAGTFPLEYGAEFYRRVWRLPWPAVAQWKEGLECDYLLWRTDESHAPPPAGFTALVRDEASGVVLARRSAQR